MHITTDIHCGIVIGEDDSPRYERHTEVVLPFLPIEGMVLKFGNDDEIELAVGHVEYSTSNDKLTVYVGVSADDEAEGVKLSRALDRLGWAQVEEE